MVKRLLLGALLVLGALCASPQPARADYVCNVGTIVMNFPLCTPQGYLEVAVQGSIATTTTFPYGSTAAQTATANSFIGIAGFDGTNVQPISTDTSGRVRVVDVMPYNGASTALVANTYAGIGGSDGTNFNPLFVSTAGVGKVSIASSGGSNIGQLGTPVAGATTSGAQYLNVNALPQLWNGTNGDSAYDALRGNVVAGTGLQANVVYGQYNSSPLAATTGTYSALQTDATGTLSTARNSSGPTAPIACDKSAAVAISTATTTAIVAVSGSTAVYVCDYHLYVVSGTLPAFQFEYGAGTACASSPTVLSGTYGGIAGVVGQSFTMGSGIGAVLRTPASQGFCIVTTGTTPNVQGYVSYAQI